MQITGQSSMVTAARLLELGQATMGAQAGQAKAQRVGPSGESGAIRASVSLMDERESSMERLHDVAKAARSAAAKARHQERMQDMLRALARLMGGAQDGTGGMDPLAGSTGLSRFTSISVSGNGAVSMTDMYLGTEGADDATLSGGNIDAGVALGAGDDRLAVSAGGSVQHVDAGAGDDAVSVSADVAFHVEGGAGRDVLSVSARAAGHVDGGAGEDQIALAVGHVDHVDGGTGDDAIAISADTVFHADGGAGDDQISVTAGDVTHLDGGAGDDQITLSTGTSMNLDAGDGDDRITLSATQNAGRVADGAGDDVVVVTAPAVELDMGQGDDRYTVQAEAVTISFGPQSGHDVVALAGAEKLGLMLAPEMGLPDITRDGDRMVLDFGDGNRLELTGLSAGTELRINQPAWSDWSDLETRLAQAAQSAEVDLVSE